jgi:hypothetical protein
MVAFASSTPAAIAVNSLDHPLEIKEEFTLRVVDEAGEHLISGRPVKLVGRRLIAQVSERLQPDMCVRIDCDDAFLHGETLGCWVERGSTFVAVELHQALTRLTELARLRRQSWDPENVLIRGRRQRA